MSTSILSLWEFPPAMCASVFFALENVLKSVFILNIAKRMYNGRKIGEVCGAKSVNRPSPFFEMLFCSRGFTFAWLFYV